MNPFVTTCAACGGLTRQRPRGGEAALCKVCLDETTGRCSPDDQMQREAPAARNTRIINELVWRELNSEEGDE